MLCSQNRSQTKILNSTEKLRQVSKQFPKAPTVWLLDHLLSLYLPPTALWGCAAQDGDETG